MAESRGRRISAAGNEKEGKKMVTREEGLKAAQEACGYDPIEWIDCSSLSCASCCPRKYLLAYRMSLVPNELRVALKFGEAIHAGLGACFDGDLSQALIDFKKIWGELDELDDPKNNSTRAWLMFQDLYEKQQNGASMFEVIPPPVGGLEIQDRVSAYEIPFAVDLGLSVPFIGRIDSFCKLVTADESYYPIEVKTSTRAGNWFLEGLEICPQSLGYCLAAKTLFAMTGLDVSKVKGIVFMAMLKAKNKVDTITHLIDHEEWKIETFVNWITRLGSELLAREEAFLTSDEDDLITLADKFFPKNPSACNPYPQHGVTGFTCDYSTLCWVGPDWRGMSDLFSKEPWRPYHVSLREEEMLEVRKENSS